MSYDARELAARAKKRVAELQRRRRDSRYGRVVGRLCSAGYLLTNQSIQAHHEPISVDDALWVGELEPRVLELLPALLIKAPALFERPLRMPADLESVVKAMRRQETPPDFRGIPGPDLARWLPRVGRKGTLPSRMKVFRFSASDLALLRELGKELGLDDTKVVRVALRALAAKHLLRADQGP